MAQWSHADRTIFTKIVYYGPAFGGKTTNLESLHRITDPGRSQKLLSVKTTDDRTLFFDLLPFDLGEILGYQVAMKLYTVPGQVRYDATRQVVLGGADAVVFVADSDPGRAEQNRWSLQNLRMNMRAKGLEPASVPVIFQFNKQDLPEAATPAEVAGWLGIRCADGFSAVATEDRGTLETFIAATGEMLGRLIAKADLRTRKEIDAEDLARHVEQAFAPHVARLAQVRDGEFHDRPPVEDSTIPIVPTSDDLLQNSVQTSVKLGERLAIESARAGRLEDEAEAFRRLSEVLRRVGANFDPDTIVDAALGSAAEVLEASAVSLVCHGFDGNPKIERTWNGLDDPLLAFDEGLPLLRRMVEAGQPCVVEDLVAECDDPEAARRLYGLESAVAVPVGQEGGRCLVAYGEQPDAGFTRHDVRFLATLAGHLSVGLEKSRIHRELAEHRDRLERTVTSRTAALRRALDELRSLDRMKDRFLSNLSHEMKTPLTAILSSAVFLRDYQGGEQERVEMIETIQRSAETSNRLLDDLFRLAGLETDRSPLELSDTTPELIAAEALEIAPVESVRVEVSGRPGKMRADVPRLARALADLLDNAAKFADGVGEVELRIRRAELTDEGQEVPALSISVLDRGPGVNPEDRERIFAPFEQGGDPLTGKPAGIGIGLYEASTIARQHGGRLEYLPRKGGGSEFRLVVPLQPQNKTKQVEVVRA